MRDGLLLELGYIPFDLAAGAVMAQTIVDPAVSIASGPIIFAGAAQLVAIQLLDSGAAIPLVVLAVFIVNARHLLYSASLEPHLGAWSRKQRLAGAFFLSDPTYALAITRFERPGGAGSRNEQLGYYFSASIVLWVGWTVLLAVGVLFGGLIPPWVPLELAIPLTFLLLVLPLLKDHAGVVAASVGGVGGASRAAAALRLRPDHRGDRRPRRRRHRARAHHPAGGGPRCLTSWRSCSAVSSPT